MRSIKKRIWTFILTGSVAFWGIGMPGNIATAAQSDCVAELDTSEQSTPSDAVEDNLELVENNTNELEISTDMINDTSSNIDYNYAKLLQYALYFYDANMCGSGVDENSLLSWRGDCHTFDGTTYTRSDGSQVYVNLAGGFHDAGDHVKFGLPEAYSAFILGMSYDTNKSAYENAGQTGHLQTITTYFADYLVNCTVLSSDGNSVEAFCCQVGQGGGGYDHGYWGVPENQTNANRPIYFTSASAPSTDIVSLSAAALAMQYKNFGGENYLSTAKKLFAYAQNNNKAVNTTANGFYNSSGWEDDYCLAAILLYQITGESQYLNEFNRYSSNGNAQKPYWPLGWDNVGPAVAYYNGNSSALSTVMNISNGNTSSDGYRCIDSWGSARYNTSMQYTGLLYNQMTGTNTYLSWAEGQMKYLLGNNSRNQCYVVGYNSYSAKYPHHRAASGYTGGPQGTTTQANVLIGALVGGPKLDGSYTDSASDYQCNEVAIDYNATLVAAAAALYNVHMAETSTQYIDSQYYSDSYIRLKAYCVQEGVNGIDVGVVYETTQDDVQFRWLVYNLDTKQWEIVRDWATGNWITWKPKKGNYWLRVEARSGDGITSDYTQAYNVSRDYQNGYVNFNGYCVQEKDDRIDVGVSYSSNLDDLQFRWLAYNLQTGKWESVSSWSDGNWVTWKPEKGNYWLRVEVKSDTGLLADYTQVYTATKDYSLSTIALNGYCVINRENGIDVGVVYQCYENVKFRWLSYNLDTKQWETVRGWAAGNWITWKPEKGNYWLRVEAISDSGITNDYTQVFSIDIDY